MTTGTSPTAGAPVSRRKLWIGGGVAVVAAAALLVFVVLPAEYGIDPLGAGKASGLSDLSKAGEMTELERGALREGVLSLTDQPIRTDRWERELAPFESVEFKYVIDEGQPIVFSWAASGPVQYDLHAHPFEGGEDLTEGYGKGEAASMQGVYVAAFSGVHGWFWENRSMDNVTLVLNATGAMDHGLLYEGSAEIRRDVALVE